MYWSVKIIFKIHKCCILVFFVCFPIRDRWKKTQNTQKTTRLNVRRWIANRRKFKYYFFALWIIHSPTSRKLSKKQFLVFRIHAKIKKFSYFSLSVGHSNERIKKSDFFFTETLRAFFTRITEQKLLRR